MKDTNYDRPNCVAVVKREFIRKRQLDPRLNSYIINIANLE